MDLSATIIAPDTAIGGALDRALRSRDITVADGAPVVVYCDDIAADRDGHVRRLTALCEHLAARSVQTHLVYVSTAAVCNPRRGRIGETAEVHPHNLREAAAVQAEMLIRAYSCLSRNAIAPLIVRHGELYGDDALSGQVASLVAAARAGRPLSHYGSLNQKRTLTHIDDFADAVAAILPLQVLPSLINIPGETLSMADVLMTVADRFGVDWQPLSQPPSPPDESAPHTSADCVLATALFKSELPEFKLSHRFKTWLRTQGR